MQRLTLFLFLLASSNAFAVDLAPKPGHTTVIIGGGFRTPHFDKFEKIVGKPPSGQHLTINNFDDNIAAGVIYQSQPENSSLFIVWNINDDLLTEIARGKRDSELEKVATIFKECGKPLYLSICGEIDNHDGRDFANRYKAAHRYVKKFFDKSGVGNVDYVMSMGCHKQPSYQEIIRNYPGDDVVDMIGCSLFGSGNVEGAGRLAIFSKRHGKPFAITESGGFVARDAHRNWQHYWGPVFNFMERYDVRLLVFLNCDDGTPTADHFNMFSSVVEKSWKREMSRPRYVLGDERFYEKIGYKSP